MKARTRVQVEQHIALGYDDQQIADRLGLAVEDVEGCRRDLDEINAEPTDDPAEALPHGSHAAHNRHKASGEAPCDSCVEAERVYQAERQQRRRRRNDPLNEDLVAQITRLTAAGVSAAQIADRLRVSTRTVNRWRARLQDAA